MRILKCDRCGKNVETSRARYLIFSEGTVQFELCKDCADDFDFDLGCMNMKYSKFKDKYEEGGEKDE